MPKAFCDVDHEIVLLSEERKLPHEKWRMKQMFNECDVMLLPNCRSQDCTFAKLQAANHTARLREIVVLSCGVQPGWCSDSVCRRGGAWRPVTRKPRMVHGPSTDRVRTCTFASHRNLANGKLPTKAQRALFLHPAATPTPPPPRKPVKMGVLSSVQ